MKKLEKFDRKIPVRNYLIVLVVSIIVIILVLYLRAFYLSYDTYKVLEQSKDNVNSFEQSIKACHDSFIQKQKLGRMLRKNL